VVGGAAVAVSAAGAPPQFGCVLERRPPADEPTAEMPLVSWAVGVAGSNVLMCGGAAGAVSGAGGAPLPAARLAVLSTSAGLQRRNVVIVAASDRAPTPEGTACSASPAATGGAVHRAVSLLGS